jgi:hypothetical protein
MLWNGGSIVGRRPMHCSSHRLLILRSGRAFTLGGNLRLAKRQIDLVGGVGSLTS